MWKQQKCISSYVTIRVITDSPERFLNLSRHKNIGFWNIVRNDEGFTGSLLRKDFYKIREICRKTQADIRILKKHGFVFWLFKYRKHYSFLVGIAAACLILYFCSLYLWNISFTGNNRYTDSTLIKYLATLNIHSGMKIGDIDCDYIERSIRNSYSDVTWVSAQINGTRLIVHIKENDGAKDTEEEAQPRDIVAENDGVVTSIVTRTGTPLVKKGDTVTAGQILVSGIVSVTDDAGEVAQNLYTCADADIMLRVELPYEEHLQQEYEYKFYTGRKKKKWIFKIFNFSAEIGINFGSYDEYDTVSDVKVMKLTDSFYLPFGTGTKECIEYKTQVRTYTEEEAQNKLKENFTDYLQDLLENKVQIISESVKIDRSGTEYVMSGTVTADVPAAGYTDISVPEIKGNEENNN